MVCYKKIIFRKLGRHTRRIESNYNTKKSLSTVLMALDLNIPDKEFDAVRIHLEADITHTEPAVEIRQVEEGE